MFALFNAQPLRLTNCATVSLITALSAWSELSVVQAVPDRKALMRLDQTQQWKRASLGRGGESRQQLQRSGSRAEHLLYEVRPPCAIEHMHFLSQQFIVSGFVCEDVGTETNDGYLRGDADSCLVWCKTSYPWTDNEPPMLGLTLNETTCSCCKGNGKVPGKNSTHYLLQCNPVAPE
mmetsp:Transcript_81653/g.141966  ORF Transcript_81653/g.141966 Transcript_81653/m.141966 type:complete len:177 (+) Transcript_81653:110-640(+)